MKREKEGAHERKFKEVIEEFRAGKLHSGSKKGPKVTSKKQAEAIAFSESAKDVRGERPKWLKRP